ncbi:glycosyltransferase family 117 protein [Brumimicrobium oceani]|uniref:DUF2723 domain-containing protein n=1 Tax=Brumimicrobium oceani TaxID=2100725 RepID=A0A2U2XDS7_9FLAO|nr:DUF2723 domain-containing protein [Brumimicrobium oceani]PWH85952.1 hypothetical protein DIT68_07635 [Brumimicrobium oceani]PWH85976.1 hypothetical protein DIT68_07770 [Brumimicrobium oceani]
MNYKKLDISIGWLSFLIATIVYFITVEDTASLWDCGEYITAAYKLEVGHPPGAPFFMLIGRVFSLFAGSEADVALWINRMSALSSSLTILFLFWSITKLGKKIAEKDGDEMSNGQKIAILGSGFVGAMAYTFTESFWFSAVEGEVYAMSSLFTAVIFWAVLKWDEEMTMIKRGQLSPEIRPLRWMVLIMFLFGLAIGVHLLGLLVLPAIAYVISHQLYPKSNLKTFLITGIAGVLALGFIQNGVIPGTIALASKMEIFFVNSLGLPFGVGAAFFFILLVGILVGGLYFTRNKGYKLGNTVILGLIMLFIGYGSFATIVIRSNANPPLDENNPENLVTLHAFLKREQYGSWPILYGEYFNSKPAKQSEFKDRSPNYDRRWVVSTSSGTDIISFKDKELAENYIKNSGQNYTMDEKYFMINAGAIENQVPVYTQNTLFPRMFDRMSEQKIRGYKNWSGYDPSRKVPPSQLGEDGRPLPTFGNNITYFVNYQVDWMYWRYFMWNFSGRQNDIQGHGDEFRGNWLSGFNVVDEARLGAQGENAPYYTQHNPSNAKFYYIPLILGLIGMFFHFLKAPKDGIVVGILFLLTGLAIVIYLNQKTFEPRERDYAYAASFYTFAIWIGLGVYGLYEAFRSFGKSDYKKLGISYAGLVFLCLIVDMSANRGMPATASILIIGGIGGGAMLAMTMLRKINAPKVGAAGFAILLGISAPMLLGVQGWEGHDRSNRSPARSLAYNYLIGLSPNSIVYTNGDNDTFPLWYLQEVEGLRTDVRVANLSLMQTDWYSNQMKMRAYESDPLPIKFREDQILMGAGNTDYVLFLDYEIYKRNLSTEKANEVIKKKIEGNPQLFKSALSQIRRGLAASTQAMTPNNEKAADILQKVKAELEAPIANPGYEDYVRIDLIIRKIFSDVGNNLISADENLLKQLENAAITWTQSWDFLPLDYAMEFVRDDANMMSQPGGRTFRYFPASGFVLPVNVENAVEAGIISEEYVDQAESELRFNFRKGGMFNSDVRGLSREEVMMMDILANFDWKRGIYFSSPGGSDVAKALYGQGIVHNYGQVHGLTPIKREAANDYVRDLMYENIINKYDYANLAEDGVLVDYYTRRHTSQYRNSFIDLVSKYISDYELSKNAGASSSSNLKDTEFYADRIESIINHSLEKLPIDKVFDFGEPRATGRRLPNGEQVYSDGAVPDYVKALFQVGKNESAEKLAIEYMAQLETMMNYFQHSDALIAYQSKQDFISFAMNFLQVYAQVVVNSPDSEAANFGNELDQKLTRDVVGKIVEDLSNKEVKEAIRGGRTRVRTMEKEALEFAKLYNALLTENGFQSDDSGNQ